MDSGTNGCKSSYHIDLCPCLEVPCLSCRLPSSSINKSHLKICVFYILGAQAPLRPSIEQISILTMENVKSSKSSEGRLSPGGCLN